VGSAIQSIYRDMEYAKTLIKRRKQSYDGGADDSEETWTFIGDESDPELMRSIADWEQAAQRKSQVVGETDSSVHSQPRSIGKRYTGVSGRSGVTGGTAGSSANTESSG
jgi:hypothetical protein